ncbi:hypothetical protein [Methanosarcina sp. WWM596]|nr:hypothetical protein [Methanosarcina sp. WWM596]
MFPLSFVIGKQETIQETRETNSGDMNDRHGDIKDNYKIQG